MKLRHLFHYRLARPPALAAALAGAFLAAPGAAPPALAMLSYNVRTWQTDDGLPQNSVFALAQTPDGYLWVGTQEGLVRFDGLRFTTVDEPGTPQLGRIPIRALLTSRDGSLWIATDAHGLARFASGSTTHFGEPDGLPGNQVRCLMESRDGTLWIGTETGLARWQDGRFTRYTEKDGLADTSIRGLYQDRRGTIRIATRRGLSALTPEGTISTLNFGLGAVANALKSVCEDRAGNLWVSSNEGVTRRGPEGDVVYTIADGLPDSIATALYRDRADRIWAGTYRGLAGLAEGVVVARPLNDAGLADLVNVIFEDREENLWVGGRDGLYRVRPARFTTITTREGLSSDNAMSVLEDRHGRLCIATWGGGLNRIADQTISVLSVTNGLSHDKALALHEGRDGSLWVGMDFDGGLNRLNGSDRNSFPRLQGLVNAPIRAIHEDARGRLWIGTGRGLNLYQAGQFTLLNPARGLAGTNVTVIHEDAQGRLWFGTEGGLSRWENDRFTNFTTADGLSHNSVNAIYEDAGHTFWIGTKGGGVNRLRNGKFTAYTTQHGLFSDEVYEIIEDDFGYLWMSCRKGIFRLPKADLERLDRGEIKTITCASFGKADGLVSEQCNGVAKPSAWKARDGRIWFPTIRGVVAVDPQLKPNDRPPPVVIERVRADQRTLFWQPAGGTNIPAINIPPGHGDVEVRFTALSLQASERNRFRFQLEGLDTAWNDAGGTRVARYFSLGPGSYRFRVLACNDDDLWNPIGAAVTLVIQPHAWQTWWFKTAVLAAAAALLVQWYRSRVARLREIENLRVQIAADLHDDVGARLTKVAMVTEWLDGETATTDRNKPHIENISRTTREIIQAMDEIVWTINPQNDTLDNLANYIFQYAQDYFQNSGVRCRLDLPAKLPEKTMSTEERHNLFMAVKEALNNILKHAHATEARVQLSVTDDRLVIVVADNGRGFPAPLPSGTGDGLNNMRTRLERIGGKLTLAPNPGGGALVRMEVRTK